MPWRRPAPPERDTFTFESVQLNLQGEIVERLPGQAQRMTLSLGGGVPLELVRVAGGSFCMGSPGALGYDDERPAHQVQVPTFWLGRHPVNQAQWRAVLGELPVCRFHGDDLPVDGVSWLEAGRYCETLARRQRLALRLPSEAEWEYACRAGTTTPFFYGPTLSTEIANYNGVHRYANEPAGPYRHAPLPVGTFAPNAWGLGEMHGTMWEWCADAWHGDYQGAPNDGSAWAGPPHARRVLRGGSWHDPPGQCRAAVRVGLHRSEADELLGMRVALSLGQATG